MKIRQGFVSNSSSSSFVVAFPRKPADEDDCRKIVFGEKRIFGNPYAWGDEEGGWHTAEIADRIFHDLKNQTPLTKEQVLEELASSYVYEDEDGSWAQPIAGAPEYPHVDHTRFKLEWDDPGYKEAYTKAWEKHDADLKAWSRKLTDKLMSRAGKDAVYFRFEYEDHNGPMETAMEHGGVFRNLPSYRISHH